MIKQHELEKTQKEKSELSTELAQKRVLSNAAEKDNEIKRL